MHCTNFITSTNLYTVSAIVQIIELLVMVVVVMMMC